MTTLWEKVRDAAYKTETRKMEKEGKREREGDVIEYPEGKHTHTAVQITQWIAFHFEWPLSPPRFSSTVARLLLFSFWWSVC